MADAPDDLAVRIQEYARNLHAFLKSTTGIFAATQEAMPRGVHQPMTLQQHDPKQDLDWRKSGQAESTQPSEDEFPPHSNPIAPPIAEDDIVKEWMAEESPQPLLLVAPIGTGKSWFLESFAYQLAEQLRDPRKWAKRKQTPASVPLLIPLHRLLQSKGSLKEYLYASAEEIVLPLGQAQSLSRAVLDYLIEKKRIVLLIDGFDEVPANVWHACETEIKKRDISFILTSRPGYGAERRVHPDRQRTLQELTGPNAREYVRCYFREIKCLGLSPSGATKLFGEACSGPISHLLTRPLYLKAWCDHVYQTPDHHAPRTLGDLAKRLLTTCIERRRLFEELRAADKHSTGEYGRAIAAFSDWLGRLGYFFATRCFREQKLDAHSPDSEVRELHVTANLRVGNQRYCLWDIAIDSGLMIKIAEEYYLPKIPLVEYCIGKYLADDASQHPEAPKRLIETYRRWIWRHNLHDILDYTFDALWHFDDDRMRQWASDLLQWALDVGRHDITRAQSPLPPAQDDLVHPFALTVLRWHATSMYSSNAQALSPVSAKNSEFDVANEAARDIGPALATALTFRCNIEDKLRGLILPGPLMRSVTESLITRHNDPANDTDARIAWLSAIEAAAGQVRESDAADIVRQWINKFTYPTNSNDPGLALMSAFAVVAQQVSETNAANIVRDWIIQHNNMPDCESRPNWLIAIAHASGRVSEIDVETIVPHLVSKFSKLAKTNIERHWCGKIIYNAASRVGETQSLVFVRKWIVQYDNRLNSTHLRRAWAITITAAASRISEANAADIVRQWITLGNDLTTDSKVRPEWLNNAIISAAGRVRENEAAGVIRYLLAQLNNDSLTDGETIFSP